MRKGMAFLLVFMIAVTMIGFSSVAYAQGMGTKLERGAVNTVTGLVGEVYVKIGEDTRDGNWFGGFFTGLVKGLGYGVGRTVIGAYELVTFPIPLPSGYRQIMDPKYAWGE